MMDGFTIRNGNATGKYAMCSATEPAGCGGGFFIAGVSLNISHCIIEDNVASTTTSELQETGYGGGVYIQNPGTIMIRNSIIRSNDASTASSGRFGYTGIGGGIFVDGDMTVENIIIEKNEISENNAAAGTATGWGSGMTLYDSDAGVTGNYFHDNDPNTRSFGSAIYATSI